LWILPRGHAGDARQITSSKYDGIEGISWTPDGKIVYASRSDGTRGIWTIDPDGGEKKPLSTGSNDAWPSVSSDGRYIVFVSERTGVPHIWRMNRDGSDLKQLTRGAGEAQPDCSPDGGWVVYESIGSGKTTLWRMRIDGSEPVQLTDRSAAHPL